MPPTWLKTVADVAITLSVVCAVVIAVDILAGRRQKMMVMNLVWPITALYFGPVGLWAYWSLGRPRAGRGGGRGEPDGGGHAHDRGGQQKKSGNKQASWSSVFKATSHCGAGCTVGDALGETALFLTGFTLLGSRLLTAYAVDFVLAYLVGLAFQFFTIAPMRGLGVKDGLIAAAKADTLSLVAFEVGMFGWMALDRLVFFRSSPPEPNTTTYWFLMQVAMVVGFLTSYPANWWLVRSGLKESM